MKIFPVLTPAALAVNPAGEARHISRRVWMCFDTIVLHHE